MKCLKIFSLACALFLNSCGIREREEALENREKEIDQREQSLLLLQKQLQLKEEELLQRQKALDATTQMVNVNDTAVLNPNLPGKWSVAMRCTATTCEGSAVGDVKNEVWEITFQVRNVIVKAMADNKLVRTYSGAFIDNQLLLTAQQDETLPQAKMAVRLSFKSDTEMEGEREITRENKCNIVYSLGLRKQ